MLSSRKGFSRIFFAVILAGGIFFISGCGGGKGATQPPRITIDTLAPSYSVAGGSGFSLVVNGSGFTSSSVVQWNGTSVPTTFGSGSILTASISNSLIVAPGTANISAKDASSGATSNTLPFGIASPAAATAGVIQIVTVALDASPANGDSLVAPSINSDGRYVAFQSAATNLVPGPASGFQDIYLRDTCLGSAPQGCVPGTTRISVTFDGSPTNGHSYDSSISADGRFVTFDSSATNILPDSALCGSTACVFLRDTCNGVEAGCTPNTTLISVALDGTTANGGSPWVSADGRFVAFDSSSNNVVSGDTNNAEDVFIRNVCFGAPPGCTPSASRVSLSSTGAQANTDSHGQAVDAVGRFVAFDSYATNLVPNDAVAPGIFVRDTCVGASSCTPSTTRADVATDGTQPNRPIFYATPAVNGDGRLVAFGSGATNLVSMDVGGQGNVYIRDTCGGVSVGCTPSTSLASLANDGTVANCGSPSQGLSMSADGRFVAFDSIATNLVPGDTFPACGFEDIFIRDTCFGAPSGCVPSTVRASVANSPNPETQANSISGYPAISGDGHYVVFLGRHEPGARRHQRTCDGISGKDGLLGFA